MASEPVPIVSSNSFCVGKRIATGGFGVVDEGMSTSGEPVAIKKELASDKVTRPTLEYEYHVYQTLAGHESIPNVKTYYRRGRFNYLVMDLLGPSLGDRFQRCNKRFSLRTTARLALGMLTAIEYIHSRGFIHRDVKPENFLLGRGTKSHVIHAVDFGLARKWGHPRSGVHLNPLSLEEPLNVIGTLPFISINAHLGKAQTRSDDLQALVYAILLFARGSLPWSQIREGTRKHIERRILEKKRSWTAARLCQDLPRELEELASYCFGLEMGDEPDYKLLHDKLTAIVNREEDTKFEWEEPGWTGTYYMTSRYDLPAVVHPVCELHESASSLPKEAHKPAIRRGDLVLLKILPEKSLDYEVPQLDKSFFPHETFTGAEWQFPYRPAVVRNVLIEETNTTHFGLDVYPLAQRRGLEGLSTRRCLSFRPLKALVDAATGVQVFCTGLYFYRSSLSERFAIEYGQAEIMSAELSVPEAVLATLEAELTEAPYTEEEVYDSDDEETRTILGRIPIDWYPSRYVLEMHPCSALDLSGATLADFGGVNGWISEIICVEKRRSLENGGESDDDDSDEDSTYWEFSRPIDRRLSCTLRVLDETGGDVDGGMVTINNSSDTAPGRFRLRGLL